MLPVVCSYNSPVYALESGDIGLIDLFENSDANRLKITDPFIRLASQWLQVSHSA